MAKVKKYLKKFGRQVWELFKAAFPTLFMYVCASMILIMVTMKGEKLEWTSKSIAWTVGCAVGAAAYNALLVWAHGGAHYDMLVSGNMKRVSAEQFEGGYKISSHKEAKEYRVWKGFAIGGWSAILTIAFGIVFGCMQAKINMEKPEAGVGVVVLIGLFLSGWSLTPFYIMNQAGITVSYFLSLLFALIPIAVSGGFYIAGAYAARAKRLRQQYAALEAAEKEANKVKKINYGGLPGTKPKKRK